MKFLFTTLLLVFTITGCKQEMGHTPVMCNNLICFPSYNAKVGPSFSTREQCKEHLTKKIKRDIDKYYYCRESL